MTVSVCIGSACHIKGARQVVEQLQDLILDAGIGDRVELRGTMCVGRCSEGVCVTVDDCFHSVSPENAENFFKHEILGKL